MSGKTFAISGKGEEHEKIGDERRGRRVANADAAKRMGSGCHGDAWKRRQHGITAEIPWYLGLRSSAQRRGRSGQGAEESDGAAVSWSNATEQCRRADRNRDQRGDAERQGDHDLEQFGRSNRAGGQSRSGER